MTRSRRPKDRFPLNHYINDDGYPKLTGRGGRKSRSHLTCLVQPQYARPARRIGYRLSSDRLNLSLLLTFSHPSLPFTNLYVPAAQAIGVVR